MPAGKSEAIFNWNPLLIMTLSGPVAAQNQYATLWTVESLGVEVLKKCHETFSLFL